MAADESESGIDSSEEPSLLEPPVLPVGDSLTSEGGSIAARSIFWGGGWGWGQRG